MPGHRKKQPLSLPEARQQMVRDQLAARGIAAPRVLQVMAAVPREEFMPAFLRAYAYQDRPFPIGYDQTISQPYMVALMTEALELQGPERVLEIGTGSGYQTAVLAQLCAAVFTVERIAELSLRAELVLHRLGHTNVYLRVANGMFGWAETAPFDAILVTAGATSLPFAYHRQLKEGGRLVIPVGPHGNQLLHRYIRRGDDWEDETLTRVAFVPLV
jgi:protein-L-isoaspartate(D-aspartate) O-methyltransferase